MHMGRHSAVLERAFAAPIALYEFGPARERGPSAMRAIAMADDAGSAATQVGMIAGAATALGAMIGAVGLWLANRMLGKAAFEAMMTARFKEIMDQQRALHAEERAAWEATDLRRQGEIANLKQTIASLAADLRRRGVIDIPENRYGDEPMITIPPGGGEAI
jgi:muconolactone delta-isomerase